MTAGGAGGASPAGCVAAGVEVASGGVPDWGGLLDSVAGPGAGVAVGVVDVVCGSVAGAAGGWSVAGVCVGGGSVCACAGAIRMMAATTAIPNPGADTCRK